MAHCTVKGTTAAEIVAVVEKLRAEVAGDELLTALKRAWDPDNVFRLNHNIAP